MNRYEPQGILTGERPPRRRRLWLFVPLVAILTAAIMAGVFMFPLLAFRAKGFPTPPLATVSTIAVHFDNWLNRVQTVGTFKPFHGADLSVEVPGVVDEVNFDSGGDVEAGAQLLRLRDGDELAKLHTLEAARDLARTNFLRDQAQLARMLISQVAFDTTAAALKSYEAQVAEQQAILAKKTVRAPFAGHLGLRIVNVGQYVSPGMPVATLQALDPIYLDFFVPQQILGQIRTGQSLGVKVDTFPNTTFTGTITTIDPKVDTATRNVAVRATLPNPGRRLLPGMFATIDIVTGKPDRILTLPQTAIVFNPYGSIVYLVEEKTAEDGTKTSTVAQTVVQTGETRGDQVAVLSGIKEGDVVVSAGQTKLQNGATVLINNDIQPTNEPNPRPVER